jgi:diguanylate cyclase (GGDEF)-like protein
MCAGEKSMSVVRQGIVWVALLLATCVHCDLSLASALTDAGSNDEFSPFEKAMDAIANKYSEDASLTLEKLNEIQATAIDSNDFSTLSAYRCYLYSVSKKNDEINRILTQLEQRAAIVVSSKFPLNAATELCLSYRESDPVQQDIHAAKAFYYVRSSQAPTLRYWIGSMYVDLATKQGRMRDAIDAARIALSVGLANKDKVRQSSALRSLALIEVDNGDKQDALEHMTQATALIAELNLPHIQLDYLLNRGFILISLKRFADALQVYRSAEAQAKKLGRADIPPIVWSNYADIFYQQGDYLESKKISEKLLNWSLQEHDDLIASYARMSLSLPLLHLGQKDAAELLFEQGIKSFILQNRWIEVRDYYAAYAEALADRGHHKNAYKALEKKIQYAEVIERESRGYATAEFRELLKAEQREKENLALKELNLLQQSEMDRVNLSKQRWWLFAALLGLGLMWAAQMIWQSRKRNSVLMNENIKLDKQRFQDALTGLFNRRYLMEKKSDIWQQALEQANRGHCGALLLIDADHFKRINDQFGHAAGDAALIEIANRLKFSVRDSDVVTRWGGEEFLIYTNLLNAESVRILAVRIMEELRRLPLLYEDKSIPLSVSIGYVLLPMEWEAGKNFDMDESLKLADSALYLAKESGRNRAAGVVKVRKAEIGRAQLIDDLSTAWQAGVVDIVVSEGPEVR